MKFKYETLSFYRITHFIKTMIIITMEWVYKRTCFTPVLHDCTYINAISHECTVLPITDRNDNIDANGTCHAILLNTKHFIIPTPYVIFGKFVVRPTKDSNRWIRSYEWFNRNKCQYTRLMVDFSSWGRAWNGLGTDVNIILAESYVFRRSWFEIELWGNHTSFLKR